MKKRDLLLLLGGAAILLVLWMAPEESTTHMPKDDNHQRFYPMVKNEGKKAAEKYCLDCHNDSGVPFPQGHPPKSRCLLCHKLNQ
jgi:hypothetical protein